MLTGWHAFAASCLTDMHSRIRTASDGVNEHQNTPNWRDLIMHTCNAQFWYTTMMSIMTHRRLFGLLRMCATYPAQSEISQKPITDHTKSHNTNKRKRVELLAVSRGHLDITNTFTI